MELLGLNGLSNNFSANSISKKENIESKSFESLLNKAIENNEDEELKKACVEFESYFLKMMMKSMRSTIIEDEGIIKKSTGEKIFQDMLDEEYCNNAAAGNNGVGLAGMLYKQLSVNSRNVIKF